jgi:putative RecB family exonuclease
MVEVVSGDVPPAQTAPARSAGPLTGLSPSRAGDFMTCPLLFRYRTLDRLPELPSPAAARGTLVHGVLEHLFDLDAAERTPAQAAAMLPAAWEQLVAVEPELANLIGADDDDQDVWFAAAADLLDRYFGLEDPSRLEPAERELYVETELEGGLRLRGYVDRLDISPGGDLRVVDYKTGKAPGEGFEARAFFQMRFYALVLWKLRGVVPRLLQLIYLGSGEVLRYEPDEADLRATERKIVAIWDAIERAYEQQDWRPNPSRFCEWCSHQAICPAFGGTPPPLPVEIEAVDETPAEVEQVERAS